MYQHQWNSRRAIGRERFEVVDTVAAGLDVLTTDFSPPEAITDLLIADPEWVYVEYDASGKRQQYEDAYDTQKDFHVRRHLPICR